MMSEVKSLEEHCGYVEGLARVSFYFARKWLAPRFPEKKIGELIRAHTPVLYHGLNYSPSVWAADPECQDLLARADRLAELDPDAFEETLWGEVRGLARRRAELNYPTAVGVKAPASWNCGSLKYDVPKPDLPPGRVVFHIANAVGPKSIFEDPQYLPYCFLLLMKESEFRFGSNELYTSTWLNCRNAWLAYFPQEWRDNLQPEPDEPPVPAWHFGWWGQLVSGRGTINPNAEKFVRTHGHLRCFCRSSHCSFENMRAHLKEKFQI